MTAIYRLPSCNSCSQSLFPINGTNYTAPLEYSYQVTIKFHGAVFEKLTVAHLLKLPTFVSTQKCTNLVRKRALAICCSTHLIQIHTLPSYFKDEVKGKVVPLQAWTGPEGSRKLRLPDFVTMTQDGGKIVSLTHRPPLPPENTPGTHFC